MHNCAILFVIACQYDAAILIWQFCLSVCWSSASDLYWVYCIL